MGSEQASSSGKDVLKKKPFFCYGRPETASRSAWRIKP